MKPRAIQLVQIGEYGDKYAIKSPVGLDCAGLLPLCHSACCRLEFAISEQDFKEGVIAWDEKRPYLCAKGPDRRCVHQEPETAACRVYEHRPAPCRTFDCRNDKRIWIDFEAREINPAIDEPGWPVTSAEGGEWPG